MRLLLLVSALILSVAVAALLAISQNGGDHAAYAEQKATYSGGGFQQRITGRRMSVAGAYRLIPHTRTPFQMSSAQLPQRDAVYLSMLFDLTDAAVVERVAIQKGFRSGAMSFEIGSNYDSILNRIKALPTPPQLVPVEAMIVEAIIDQRRYFSEWQNSGSPRFINPRDQLIQTSHRNLIAAYDKLMRLYPREAPHNKNAFYDHL